MKIPDAIEGFLLDRRPQSSNDTARWYKQKLGRWCRSMERTGVTDIAQIMIGHLRSFIVDVQGTLSDAENSQKPAQEDGRIVSDLTAHGYAQIVKTFCRWLYLEELADRDPLAQLAMPKVSRYVIKGFTLEQGGALEKRHKSLDTVKSMSPNCTLRQDVSAQHRSSGSRRVVTHSPAQLGATSTLAKRQRQLIGYCCGLQEKRSRKHPCTVAVPSKMAQNGQKEEGDFATETARMATKKPCISGFVKGNDWRKGWDSNPR